MNFIVGDDFALVRIVAGFGNLDTVAAAFMSIRYVRVECRLKGFACGPLFYFYLFTVVAKLVILDVALFLKKPNKQLILLAICQLFIVFKSLY